MLHGIKEHATEWKQVLGNMLLTETVRSMEELKATIDKFRIDVELVINGLERFKLVMQCISDVKHLAIQAEVKYMQFQVRSLRKICSFLSILLRHYYTIR